MDGEPEVDRPSRLRRAVRRVAIDVSPLRASRDFRRLWLGHVVSNLGYHFTVVASFFQVFRITGSAAAVGLIGLIALAAIVAGTLFGSSFIDAYDRRRIMLFTQAGFVLATSVLVLGSLVGSPPVWIVYAAIALISALSPIDSSVRHALTPRLVGRELLPSALTLNQVLMNATGLIGPALAGLVIEVAGLSWAYAIDLCSYVAMLVAVRGISPAPPEHDVSTGWTAVREGFTFLRGRRVIQAAFGMDIVAMVFGMPRALFPILALVTFDGGPAVAGLLFAAPAVGALAAGVTGGWLRHVHRQGLAVTLAVIVWGAGITAFGLAGSNLILALFFLAVAGGADVVSAVFRHTILQLSVPDALRGRMSGINYLVVAGGPRLGDLEAGLVAAAFSPMVSIVSGGLLCIGAALVISRAVPSLRRYDARVDA